MSLPRLASLSLMAANLLLLSSSAHSQNLTDEWVRKAAEPLIENHIVDGVSIGYLEGKNYGYVHLGSANRSNQPATNTTLYELGSISKVFTSLLLADAVVRGEIDLNADASIDNSAGIRFPSRAGKQITWIDLSTHRSGLPRLPENLAPTSESDPYREYDSKQAAAFLRQFTLPRLPGAEQEYSNFAVSVLGYLVAQNSGTTYQQLLQSRIAQPLGMTDCTVTLTSDQRKRMATLHDEAGSTTAPWTFADMPGAGGIRATMRDMMRFAKAQLYPPKNTTGQAIELAWKQHSEADDSGSAMGLGWSIAGDEQTRWHNGQTGGSTSAIFINRKLKSAVIVLSNTSTFTGIDELAATLIRRAAGINTRIEPDEPDDGIDAKHRSRLVGRYQLAPNFVFDVRDVNGRMMVGITNQPTQEVFPDSPTRWSYRSVDATLEFKLSNAGPARSLILHQNGNKQTARRVK